MMYLGLLMDLKDSGAESKPWISDGEEGYKGCCFEQVKVNWAGAI